MSLWAIYNVYQEAQNLPRAMDSVETVFGSAVHVTVDGRYPDFPGDSETSTDGTREIAEARGLLLTCLDYECEKRTAALRFIDEHAVTGDWVLVLDADETVTERFAWPVEKVGAFSFQRRSDGREYGRNRLYRWEPGLHFEGRHYDLYDSNDELFATLEAPPCELIGAGYHYDTSHDPIRMAHKENYYTVLRKREGSPWLQPTP